MQVEWEILPKDDGIAPNSSGVYVTINRRGAIALNKVAYGRMGEPAAFLIMFDKTNSRIMLKPAALATKHAYRAGKNRKRGGPLVRAYRLITQFGVKIPETLEFKDAEIDIDGQLILDLRTTRISPRARKLNR